MGVWIINHLCFHIISRMCLSYLDWVPPFKLHKKRVISKVEISMVSEPALISHYMIILYLKMNQLYEVHIDSFDELQLESPIEYQIDSENNLTSQNTLLLYSVVLFINKKFTNAQFRMIEKQVIPIPGSLKHKLLSFLGKVSFIFCPNLKENNDFKVLNQYAFREGNQDIKMMIKFIDDVDDSKYLYICVFYESEETYSLIRHFFMKKITIFQSYKFKKIIIKENIKKLSKVYTDVDQNSENMLVYGKKNYVEEYCKLFAELSKTIKVKKLPIDSEMINSSFFKFEHQFTESFHQTSTFVDSENMHIAHRQRSKEFLIERQYPEKQIPISSLKMLFRSDKGIQWFMKENCEVDQKENSYICTPAIKKKLQNQIRIMNEEEGIKDKEEDRYKLKHFKNIHVPKQKYGEFLKICSSYKSKYPLEYKIDVNKFIRIVNFAKQCQKVYLVFRTYDQIINLQAAIEDQIELSVIKKVIDEWSNSLIPNVKEIKTKNKKLCLSLNPLIVTKPEDFIISVKNGTEFQRTVLCTKDILEEFLKYEYDFNINFVVNQPLPCFPFLIHFSKIQYAVMQRRCSAEKEYQVLKEILQKDRCEYAFYENQPLSAVDNYNIFSVIANGGRWTESIVSKQEREKEKERELVYLIYFQKLYEVKRVNGIFEGLEEVNIKREKFSIGQRILIEDSLKKAFIAGQRFLSFTFPLLQSRKIEIKKIYNFKTRIKNYSLVNIWDRKLSIEGGDHCLVFLQNSREHLVRNFSKKFKMKFNDEEIIRKVKTFRIGYGSLNRFKEENWVGVQADSYICQQIINQLSMNY